LKVPGNSWIDWPFFEARHRELASNLSHWASENLSRAPHQDAYSACRQLVRKLGQAGWLKYAVGGKAFGGVEDSIDTRAICIIRETLSFHSGLADFVFAMQGLGSGAISLFGTAEQKNKYLPRVADGGAIAAFALSEPDTGSDAASLTCEARAEGGNFVLNGEKTWISNGGIADFYVVFARSGEAAAARGISAFLVEPHTPGFAIEEKIEAIAPHPLARISFTNCAIPASQRLGEPGQGFKVAMATLDVFRTSVAGAAMGLARRALAEALKRATSRKMFGQLLSDFQLTQGKLAEMAAGIDAAALLTYRAAWLRDQGERVTVEAAMAKMTATETAQKVIDAAVQIFGGQGVKSGEIVEQLYREIRPLRIYEGATEVQQLVIARGILKAFQETQNAHEPKP
jgi:acyl-CoA dehydrogenase